MTYNDRENLTYIATQAEIAISRYDGKRHGYATLDTLGILERQMRICTGIIALSDDDDLVTGILLRALLLDALVLIKAEDELEVFIAEKRLGKFNEYCQQFMFDDRDKAMIRSVQNMASTGRLSQSQAAPLLNKFSRPPGHSWLDINASKIEKQLAQGQRKTYVNRLVRVYDIYSKYDHYNRAYFDLKNENPESRRLRLRHSIEFLLHATARSIEIMCRMNQPDKEGEKQSLTIGQRIIDVTRTV